METVSMDDLWGSGCLSFETLRLSAHCKCMRFQTHSVIFDCCFAFSRFPLSDALCSESEDDEQQPKVFFPKHLHSADLAQNRFLGSPMGGCLTVPCLWVPACKQAQSTSPGRQGGWGSHSRSQSAGRNQQSPVNFQ